MSRRTDRTARHHDRLEWLRQRVAELERERAQRQPENGSITLAVEQHYRLLFEHALSMYFALLPDGTVLSVNRYGAEHLGYVAEELIGHSVLSLFGRVDHPTVLNQLATCARNPSQIFEWEIVKIHKNGGSVWVKERAQAVPDGKGRLTILVACEDITAHHEAETRRKQTEASLRELNLALSHAMPGIARLNPEGLYTEVNDYYAGQLGYAPEDLIGQSWRPTVYPEDRSRAERAYEQLCLVGQAEFEALAVRKNGECFHKQVFMLRINDAAGRMIGHHCFMRNISRRKQAEQELHRIKQRLQHLITASPAIVYACNPCGDFGTTYISDNVFEQLGYTPHEFVEDSGFWSDHIHPDDRTRVLSETTNLLRVGYHETDYRFRHKDGTYRWIHDRLRLVRDKADNAIELVGSWIDITERKRAEEALKASEERVRLTQYAVDHADDYIFLIGHDGHFLDVNESACRRLGYTKEELLSMSVMDIDPDFPPSAWDSFWAKFKAMKRVHLETRHRSKSGEIYPVEVTANYFRHNGQELDYAIVRDITERKRAEEALRKSHAYLRQIIDVDPNFIFAKDREGRFTLVNQAVADAYGTTVEELIGKTDADFNPNREEVEFFRKMDLEVMDTRSERFIPEEAITDAAGKTRWVQTVKRPMLDKDGRATQVLGAATDITERKLAEEQRERLSQDLHDNLLQSLYAVGMQLEASRLASNFSATQSKTYIGQAINQLNLLVQDVRNFIASLKHRAIPRQDLGQALRHLVASLSFADASAPQLEIEPAAVAAIRPDHGDHVLNIAREALSNSLRHAHARSRWLRFSRNDSAVRMVIADDGLGFHPSKNHRQGHGLGHMAERAKLIGARLHVESVPGRGTSIIVEVPLGHGDADV
jgi:PAS domain S-box-containing protein